MVPQDITRIVWVSDPPRPIQKVCMWSFSLIR